MGAEFVLEPVYKAQYPCRHSGGMAFMNQPRPESSVPALATAEHFLACVDVMVDWSALEPLLAAASAATTRPLTLSTFKIALLKQWYGIAESETAFAVLDRLSFRSFVGFNDD